MSVAWMNANATVVQRLERRDRKVATFAEMLPFTPPPKLKRELRHAHLTFLPTQKHRRRAFRKIKTLEVNERRAAFLGPEMVFGRGDGRFAIELRDGRTLAITDEANKRLRRDAAKDKLKLRKNR